MKDMGEARYILGMTIVINHPKRLLSMCQEAYIKRMLEHFLMHYFKPINSPVEKSLTLILNKCLKTDDEKCK